MKCISLFVCFFIGLQSMIVPSYEVLISNIESKVDTIHEDRASFLSLKCRDIAMDVTSKKTDLRIEMDKQEKCVDELERRYKWNMAWNYKRFKETTPSCIHIRFKRIWRCTSMNIEMLN